MPRPGEPAPNRSRLSPDQACLLLLLALPLVFLWRVVLLGDVLLPLDVQYRLEPWRSESVSPFPDSEWNSTTTDIIWQYYPLAASASQLRSHGPALWDPNPLGGMPALARARYYSNPVFNLLDLVTSPGRAMSLLAVFNLMIAGVFMFLLLRELELERFAALVGALAFAYNGYLIGWLSFSDLFSAASWLPAVFWGFERSLRRRDLRWAGAGAAAFAFQILSGTLLWSVYGIVTFASWAAVRTVVEVCRERSLVAATRPIVAAAVVPLLGAALAAPQLLLTAELFPLTVRGADIGMMGGLPLSHLVRLLVPDFWGHPLHGGEYVGPHNFSETGQYLGVLPLVLLLAAPLSRKRALTWFCLAIGLVTLLAVYRVEPFRTMVTLAFPGFLKTFPGRVFFVSSFAFAIAAAAGADVVATTRRARWVLALAIASLTIGATLAIGAGVIHSNRGSWVAELGESAVTARISGLVLAAALITISGVLLWWWSKDRGSRIARAGLVAITAADLLFFGMRYNPVLPLERASWKPPSLDALLGLLHEETQPARVLTVNSGIILPGATSLLYAVPTATGYSSWVLARTAAYADATGMRAPTHGLQVYYGDCCNPLIDALNVKYIYSEGPAGRLSRRISDVDMLAVRNPAFTSVQRFGSVQLQRWTIDGDERPVLQMTAPSRVDYRLMLGGQPRFLSALALKPEAWERCTDGVELRVDVTPKGELSPQTVMRRRLDPRHEPSDRHWLPVEVDLSAFTGKQVTISLVADPGPDGNTFVDWAGWAQPRLLGNSPGGLELAWDGPNRIYRNTAALPRAWPVHRVTEIPAGDLGAGALILAEPGFEPRDEAVVEGQLPGTLGLPDPDDDVTITSYEPTRVRLRVRLAEPALVVLSDTYYPGWKARIDGASAVIHATNLVMRGVHVPAGEHELELVYRPPRFYLGLVISAMAVIGFALLLTNRRWPLRRRRG